MADAWELPDPPGIINGSDSDSESSSSSAPSSGASTLSTELAPRPCRQARPGRGRPRGQGGTRAQRDRRDRFLAARGILPDEAPPAPAPSSIVAVPTSKCGWISVDLLLDLGGTAAYLVICDPVKIFEMKFM